jgi:hypothetical protein
MASVPALSSQRLRKKVEVHEPVEANRGQDHENRWHDDGKEVPEDDLLSGRFTSPQ